jgi:hypothetical protein
VEKDACGGAVEHVVEAVGEDLGLVDFAVAVSVCQTPDDLGFSGEFLDAALGFPFFMERPAVGGFSSSEIVEIPVKVVAVVLDTLAEAVGLRHVDAAFEFRHVPQRGFTAETAFPDGLADDLAVDEQLRRRLSRMVAAGDVREPFAASPPWADTEAVSARAVKIVVRSMGVY